jgi:hypothetical protein
MTHQGLISELQNYLPLELAEDIVNQFLSIRSDVATFTLERSAPGKFVETVVQILQYLSEGSYSKSFKTGEVEDFLKNAESRPIKLLPDLRINVTRIARGMYSLRSKRSIVHKGTVDPNICDLRYLYSSAQWVLSEIIRNLFSTDMNTAGQLVEFIQIPVLLLVEDFSGFSKRRLVLASGTAEEEMLTLLLSYYPDPISTSQIYKDMNRRHKSTVANTRTSLYNDKLIEGGPKLGYKLTFIGYRSATEIARKMAKVGE